MTEEATLQSESRRIKGGVLAAEQELPQLGGTIEVRPFICSHCKTDPETNPTANLSVDKVAVKGQKLSFSEHVKVLEENRVLKLQVCISMTGNRFEVKLILYETIIVGISKCSIDCNVTKRTT